MYIQSGVTKIQKILLFINASAYKTSNMFSIWDDSYYDRQGAAAIMAAIAFGIFECIDKSLKIEFEISKYILVTPIVLFGIIQFAFDKKIKAISQDYFEYYSKYLLYTFIFLVTASVCDMFYTLYEKI